jgi:hypothetical protein
MTQAASRNSAMRLFRNRRSGTEGFRASARSSCDGLHEHARRERATFGKRARPAAIPDVHTKEPREWLCDLYRVAA